jgi:hypothetical protein
MYDKDFSEMLDRMKIAAASPKPVTKPLQGINKGVDDIKNAITATPGFEVNNRISAPDVQVRGARGHLKKASDVGCALAEAYLEIEKTAGYISTARSAPITWSSFIPKISGRGGNVASPSTTVTPKPTQQPVSKTTAVPPPNTTGEPKVEVPVNAGKNVQAPDRKAGYGHGVKVDPASEYVPHDQSSRIPRPSEVSAAGQTAYDSSKVGVKGLGKHIFTTAGALTVLGAMGRDSQTGERKDLVDSAVRGTLYATLGHHALKGGQKFYNKNLATQYGVNG